MHRVLLGLAIGTALSAPASSKSFGAAGFSASAGFHSAAAVVPGPDSVRVHHLTGVAPSPRDHHHRSGRGGFVYIYPPDFYDANYDIDRSWQPDSFNDWWHDRPDRAFPRWVWHNRECSEDRMWSSGAGWRCTP